ncbi:hypothetical protein HKD37_18G051603 [Glycine soja]
MRIQETIMSALNSTPFTPLRDQVVNVFKELQEILIKFLTLLIALISVTNTESGKLLFTEQHKLMMSLILTIVLYFLFASIGTILQIYKGNFLQLVIWVMLIVGGVVSVLSLSFISATVAWITLAMWVGIFAVVAYDYGVPQRIINWIKETKKKTIDKSLCQALWGSAEVMWEMQPANNSAGGILCMWNETIFKLQNKVIGNGFIFLEGECIREAQKVCIVTIYSPCDIHNKRILWDTLRQLKQSSQVGLWCVLGDFNSIRNPTERIGKSERLFGENSMQEFNEWIDDLEVLKVPSVGRQYTWFRSNGESRSRLDRFLISPEWRDRWPESVQFTLPRNFSDRCPILLRNKSFREVVHQCWNSVQVSGWGAYVLKEKIKRLKHRLKTWNKEQYGDSFKKVQNLEDELNKDQVVNVFKELQEILIKFLTLSIALISLTNTESGKLLFTEQHKLMMSLILTIVLYFLFASIGTILQIYKRNLLPLVIWVMLIVGGVVSVLALSFISATVAWITLAMWVGIFAVVAYDYGVPQRIMNWVKGPSS